MPGKLWNDGSDEWEKYVIQLLKLHYTPTEFVEIPDKDRGDCGLEGFSRNGHAYQCYAAEEPLDTEGLLKKQKAKITTDLKKLTTNKTNIAAMLGPVLLSRWILVVPRWESRFLIEHAEKKAAEVRAAGLGFISSDFAVHISTEEDFKVESRLLVENGLQIVRITAPRASESHIAAWTQENSGNNQLVQNLERKLRVLQRSSNDFETLKNEMIKHYLDGQNILQGLSNQFPEMHVRCITEKGDHERFLSITTRLKLGDPGYTITSQMEKFQTKLQKALPGVSDANVEQLAWEAVADWLLRCPLEILSSQQI